MQGNWKKGNFIIRSSGKAVLEADFTKKMFFHRPEKGLILISGNPVYSGNRLKRSDMAKEKTTLKRFETVALPKEKAQQIKGGYKVSTLPRAQPSPGFVGWGEVEIRNNGLQVTSGMPLVIIPRRH